MTETTTYQAHPELWPCHAVVRLQRDAVCFGVVWVKTHPRERMTTIVHLWPLMIEIGPHATLVPGRRIW